MIFLLGYVLVFVGLQLIREMHDNAFLQRTELATNQSQEIVKN